MVMRVECKEQIGLDEHQANIKHKLDKDRTFDMHASQP